MFHQGQNNTWEKKKKQFAVVKDWKQFIMCLVNLSLELYWQTTEHWETDMQMKCSQNETLTLSRNNKLHPCRWLAHTFPFTPSRLETRPTAATRQPRKEKKEKGDEGDSHPPLYVVDANIRMCTIQLWSTQFSVSSVDDLCENVLVGVNGVLWIVYMFMYIYIWIYIYAHTYLHTYTHICVYMYKYIYLCMHIYTYIFSICMHGYVFIYVYTHTYVCIKQVFEVAI